MPSEMPTDRPSEPPESGSATGEAVKDMTAPAIVGDVVFGAMGSPVAVCTLGSRSLLQPLAGRPEIAVAGRVFTENIGIERMVQNIVGLASLRFLLVCGRETDHQVGQTILALHANGLDARGRVVGSVAPEPVLPNLTAEQLQAFQKHVTVVDLIGETDVEVILARARECAAAPTGDAVINEPGAAGPGASAAERIKATLDPQSAWQYDPAGYFLILIDRPGRALRAEQYSQQHQLLRVIEGAGAAEIGHTIVRLGLVTLLAHATYLGRELARAEAALRLGLDYEQDRPLSGRPATS
jgi:tetrahydromethanopterin S-methyltransferase subunit A